MKKILSKTVDGKSVWVITPDVRLANINKRRLPLSYLDIFYAFAPLLVKSTNKKKWEEGVKSTMIDLNNRVASLNFIVTELKKHESRLLSSRNDRKTIYDYRPFQIFFFFANAYLDCLHSIRDLLMDIDRHLGRKYHEDIIKEDWFKLYMDIRTLCHHIETPLITVEQGAIMFRFERWEKIKRIQFLSGQMQDKHGIITISLSCSDLGVIVLRSLNKWAKRYLDHINTNEAIDQVKSIKKDGTSRTGKITLNEMISLVEGS